MVVAVKVKPPPEQFASLREPTGLAKAGVINERNPMPTADKVVRFKMFMAGSTFCRYATAFYISRETRDCASAMYS